MKGKISEKRQAQAKKTDLVDWLLAIDACLTRHIQKESIWKKSYAC